MTAAADARPYAWFIAVRAMRCTRLLIHRLRAAGLLLALVTLAVPAMAQAPTYEVHPDFLVKRWTVEDGLPVNQINDLVQTRDGYL